MPTDHAQLPRRSAGETAGSAEGRYARPAPGGAIRTDAAGVTAHDMVRLRRGTWTITHPAAGALGHLSASASRQTSSSDLNNPMVRRVTRRRVPAVYDGFHREPAGTPLLHRPWDATPSNDEEHQE